MRKIKEVLRLKYELGLGQRQIARSCSIGLGTVNDYLARAERANLRWPLPEGWDDEQLNATLFGGELVRTREPERTLPDFAHLHEERRKSKHVTRQLLWEECKEANPDGCGYSRFCELYQRWRSTQDVVLRQEHKAGEKAFIDWAGPTIQPHRRQDHAGEPVCGGARRQFSYLCRSVCG
ncbi:MAG: Integrase, catalytic region [Bryobacterales bacterium]|nr:Integrase, catalytic region [Bryobacterales bacterium]